MAVAELIWVLKVPFLIQLRANAPWEAAENGLMVLGPWIPMRVLDGSSWLLGFCSHVASEPVDARWLCLSFFSLSLYFSKKYIQIRDQELLVGESGNGCGDRAWFAELDLGSWASHLTSRQTPGCSFYSILNDLQAFSCLWDVAVL